MNQLIIVENELPISTDLCKLFEKRNISPRLVDELLFGEFNLVIN